MNTWISHVRGWLIVWVMGTLLGVATFGWTGQESVPGPLTEEQLLSLVTSAKLGELSAGRVSELVRKRGVGFAVTDVFLLELQTRGAEPAVLETLREIRGQGKDFVPTASQGPHPANPPAPPSQAAPPQTAALPTSNAVEGDWPK